ncbi:hypothetical protein E2C01_064626 [Portunus trituberculatus]|uniref:Uncharacterized protein n=1 Tax=Portunus trituberculatus TaxID=210409 RepID=A0A5B7HKV7_PORTR|nr:hypothetical protein [Portunus trituberculatus]
MSHNSGGSHSLPCKDNSPSSHKNYITYYTHTLHLKVELKNGDSKSSLRVPF